jgi:hypothetical protein
MDPVLKLWMFENWIADQRDKSDLAKNHGYLIGSFINPEAVKKLTDDGNKFESTDEEFEESMKMVRESNKVKIDNKPVRKRFKLKREHG